jgi:hypothetical protein
MDESSALQHSTFAGEPPVRNKNIPYAELGIKVIFTSSG